MTAYTQASELNLEVYDYIKSYAVEHGYLPTIQEIADHFYIAVSSAHFHLRRLTEFGYISRHGGARYSVKGLRYVAD